MEKAYKTMKQVGALNIALGVITIVIGLVVGILMLTAEIGRASCRERV